MFISKTIECFQSKKLSLEESVILIEDVRNKLSSVGGKAGKEAYSKLCQVLGKNIGCKSLHLIANILKGKNFNFIDLREDLTSNEIAFYKFASLNSADVKRSFSMYL